MFIDLAIFAYITIYSNLLLFRIIKNDVGLFFGRRTLGKDDLLQVDWLVSDSSLFILPASR